MTLLETTLRDGDLYESLEDMPVDFVTHWAAPFTGGGKGTLPKGTTIRLVVIPRVTSPAGYYAHPLNKEEIELLLVPAEERSAPKYSGMSLVVLVEDLSKRFRKLSGAPDTVI